jgi:hypothetical protein
MADWTKKGAGGNVDSGSGSKGGSSSRDGSKGGGRARGPDVAMADGGSSGHSSGDKPSTATEKTKNVEFAEGGDTHMFGEQEADKDTGTSGNHPSSGKPDARGPGDKFAAGGKNKMFGFAGALPATAGISAARES